MPSSFIKNFSCISFFLFVSLHELSHCKNEKKGSLKKKNKNKKNLPALLCASSATPGPDLGHPRQLSSETDGREVDARYTRGSSLAERGGSRARSPRTKHLPK